MTDRRLNILVAGATGKTGRHVVRELVERGHATTALVRASSDTSDLPQNVSLRRGDLTDLRPDVCNGMDVVIFAAGSGSDTGAEMTEQVDREGAQRLVEIADAAGVDRFVMLSSVGADQSDPEGDLAHYLKAKHDADTHLMASELTWAILRPVALTDDGPSDEITLGGNVDKSATAARADVARLLADAAVDGRFDGQALDMQSG